jgi:uncharacterized protein YbaR (Trm112 family)
MPAKLATPTEFDESELARLACPACHGDLCSEDARLICSACGRRYPIVDGIPVLIVERAETIVDGKSGGNSALPVKP